MIPPFLFGRGPGDGQPGDGRWRRAEDGKALISRPFNLLPPAKEGQFRLPRPVRGRHRHALPRSSMRLSRYFLPILRETPKEAEIVSHRLMLRAGKIGRAHV